MRIISNNIDFDLPADFAAELTRNNVMLTDAGEQTAPITLPPTPTNLKLVGYSDRIDNYYKPLTDLDVVVSDGLFYRKGNLGIHTATTEDGISATIYFATGDFYSKVGEKKLASLAWPIYKSSFYSTNTLRANVEHLITRFKYQYTNPEDGEIYRIAPVATTQEFTWKKPDNSSVSGKFILNGFEKYQHQYVFLYSETTLEDFEGEFFQRLVIGDSTVDITKGYGMTPFLKLRYIIDLIFTSSGYTFDPTQISSIVSQYANDIVLVNNVADAIYSGILYFRQLVPDVTVKVFIAEVEKLLGGKFTINEIEKAVTFKFYESTLNSTPDLDLSQYAVSAAKLGAAEFTSVKLTDGSSNSKKTDESETKVETIDFDFLKEVYIQDEYYSPLTVPEMMPITLSLVTIDGITHANSSVVVDGKVTEEKPTPSSVIQFMNTKKHFELRVANTYGLSVNYRASYMLFYDMYDTSLATVESFYPAYKNFKLNSNIPIPVEMNIPDYILENMNINTPKLFQGQKVMIESIVQILGKRENKKVNLRTLREFFSR